MCTGQVAQALVEKGMQTGQVWIIRWGAKDAFVSHHIFRLALMRNRPEEAGSQPGHHLGRLLPESGQEALRQPESLC